MISTDELADATVRALVTAINAGDRDAFMSLLKPGATLADDGVDRNLDEWIDREIFTVAGHMDVESQSADGRSLVARYRNNTWGEMRTTWSFTITDGKIARIETGQA